jgi:F-type H+-transporting ATPase subunit b
VIPDLSVLWVIFFVLVFTTAINRLLLRPLGRVMSEREGAVQAARGLADEAAAQASRASEEVETRTRAARDAVAAQMADARRAAQDERGTLLDASRRQAEASVAEARAQVAADADAARERLSKDVEDLAGAIASRVLGRHVG